MPVSQTMNSAMSEREWKIIGGKRRASATASLKRQGAVNIEINQSVNLRARMRCIYRTIARLECLDCKTLCSPKSFNPPFCQNRFLRTQTFERETADMGKDKVPYQLKTPKGTKDCTHFPSIHHLVRR